MYRSIQSPIVRRTVLVILIGIASFNAHARGQYAGYQASAFDAPDDRMVFVFAVDGIAGPLGAAVLEDLLESLDALDAAVVSAEAAKASIIFDPEAIDPDAIAVAVADATDFRLFPLPEYVRSATFRIPDLDTRGAGNAVNDVVSELPGVLGGTIRAHIAVVDFDSREISAERIAEAIRRDAFLEEIEISEPASDPAEPEETAVTVIEFPHISDYRSAAEILNAMPGEGIYGGELELETSRIAIHYAIDTVTARQIELAAKDLTDGTARLVTVDKADKPEGLNRNGWFVVTISVAAVALFLLGYFLVKRIRRTPAEA